MPQELKVYAQNGKDVAIRTEDGRVFFHESVAGVQAILYMNNKEDKLMQLADGTVWVPSDVVRRIAMDDGMSEEEWENVLLALDDD